MRLALVLTAAVAALSLAAARPPAATAHPAAKPRAASSATVARALALRVTGARTRRARRAALLGVARALDLGVYTKRGQALVRGAEAGPRDIYLLDAEVTALASALERHVVFAPADVARQLDFAAGKLAAAGVRVRRRSFDDRAVATSLTAAVRRARARPRDRASLLPLLVRELGLRARPAYDLARPVAPDAIRLDALQRSLLLADMAGTLARSYYAARGPSRRLALGAAGATTPTAACDFDGAGESGKFGRWILSLLPELRVPGTAVSVNAGRWIRLLNVLADLYHGGNLGLLVDLQPTRTGQVWSTHYGPAGHPNTSPGGAGRSLVFQVGLQMLEDVDGPVASCLKVLGLKFPKKGPIPGVRVRWDALLSGYGALSAHGRIVREDRVTGADGVAALVVQPRDELVPGLGREETKTDAIQPTADVLTAFGSTLGLALELGAVVNPRFTTMPWSVDFHRQWVFDAALDGSQSTVWSGSDTSTPLMACMANWTGNGAQTIRFTTASPARLVFYEDDSGALKMTSGAAPSRYNSTVPVALSALVDRRGTQTEESSGEECGDGGGGGPPPPPPPSTCSPPERADTLMVALSYEGALRLDDGTASGEDPFGGWCPISSPYARRLVSASIPLARDAVADEARSSIELPLAGGDVQDVDSSTTFVSPRATVVHRTVRKGGTTMGATVRLTRVSGV